MLSHYCISSMEWISDRTLSISAVETVKARRENKKRNATHTKIMRSETIQIRWQAYTLFHSKANLQQKKQQNREIFSFFDSNSLRNVRYRSDLHHRWSPTNVRLEHKWLRHRERTTRKCCVVRRWLRGQSVVDGAACERKLPHTLWCASERVGPQHTHVCVCVCSIAATKE